MMVTTGEAVRVVLRRGYTLLLVEVGPFALRATTEWPVYMTQSSP